MSKTANFQSQAVTEWMKLFPRQVTETYTSSVKFMKQLTVVAISTITYLKNVFPEDSYTVENFGGIRLRILKKKCRDELAQFLSVAMTQAFEAFDKKYLHKMVICFYDGDYKASNLVEYHLFEYTYNAEGVSMNVESSAKGKHKQSSRYSFDNIKDRTIHLIRACVVIMQASNYELPQSYDICVRLYYNENAPKDYQAPGFARAEEEEDHLVSTLSETIKLGFVETPFHRLTNSTYIKENIVSSHEANPTQNPPEFEVTPEEHEFDSTSMSRETSELNDTRIQCPCSLLDNDADAHGLITCKYCNTQQHAACFGLYRENAERLNQHCCTVCSDADPTREPTDQRLATLTGQRRRCLCVFRRALSVSARVRSVSARRVADKLRLPPRNAAKLMNLLHSHGVIADGDSTDLITPRQIYPDRLKSVMSNFFREDSDVVENLISESMSQEERFDPIGEILSPMERASLQSAATTVKIIEPEPNKHVDDEHLKEYMDVMSKVEKEKGVPLSGSHNPINVDMIEAKKGKRKIDETLKVGIRMKRAKVSASE